MTRLRIRRGVPIATTLAMLVACERPQPPRPAIGFGSVGHAAELEQLSADTQRVRIVFDSSRWGDQDMRSAVTRAERLVEEPGLIGVVGHSSSRTTLAAAPIYRRAGVPLVVPTSTSRLLREESNAFVLVPNDSIEGGYIARFAHDSLHARSAWILYINDAYGVGLRDGMRTGAEAVGIAVRAEVPYSEEGDIALLLEAHASRARPDVILLAGREKDSRVIVSELAHRMPGVPVVMGDGAGGNPISLSRVVNPRVPVYVATFWWPRVGNVRDSAFVASWRAITGEHPAPIDALKYDAAQLLVAAVEDGQRTPAQVTRWLESLGRTRAPWTGLVGPVAFTPDTRRPLVMLRPTAEAIHVAAR
ncbi:MAG: ABC transporter substrate-binding protein [Gemmatimonadaceae bacterium]|jgi:branched-chain amino acid transport system substrate-binding protein|nr:ABC transporter substrate-binding protein [Gemmatimonadaceae bacterium]